MRVHFFFVCLLAFLQCAYCQCDHLPGLLNAIPQANGCHNPKMRTGNEKANKMDSKSNTNIERQQPFQRQQHRHHTDSDTTTDDNISNISNINSITNR